MITAVQGPALAGGFERVLACDLALAAPAAHLALTETSGGTSPYCGIGWTGHGTGWRRQLTPSRARGPLPKSALRTGPGPDGPPASH